MTKAMIGPTILPMKAQTVLTFGVTLAMANCSAKMTRVSIVKELVPCTFAFDIPMDEESVSAE